MAMINITSSWRVSPGVSSTHITTREVPVHLPADDVGDAVARHLREVLQPEDVFEPRPESVRQIVLVVTFSTEES